MMGGPSSMWSSRPPTIDVVDTLTAEERAAVLKIRNKRQNEERKALRARERTDRLAALRKEVADLEAEERTAWVRDL